MEHEWQVSRFTHTRTCAHCHLLPLDQDDADTICAVAAPVDSDTYPVSVLVQGDDLDNSDCDDCRRPAEEWPRGNAPGGARPGAMFAAALYCSICMPTSWNPDTGERVDTETGEI